jgi:hypothetical protein
MISGHTFEVGTTTTFDVLTNSVYIITNVLYNKRYKVEAWLDEATRAPSITTSNASGKLAFTINNAIQDQTRIRYSVYETVVEQRQSVSKALKFKPQADE